MVKRVSSSREHPAQNQNTVAEFRYSQTISASFFFRPEELLALRKLRRGRQGIDIQKLNKGEGKKRKRAKAEEELPGGDEVDVKGRVHADDDERVIFFFGYAVSRVWSGILCCSDSDEEAKARRVVRANNFTQQTNALDVDKHMSVTLLSLRKL